MSKFKMWGAMSKQFIRTYKSEIATGAGIAMEVAAVSLAARAGFRANRKYEEIKARIDEMHKQLDIMELGPEMEVKQQEFEKEEKKLMRDWGKQMIKDSVLPVVFTIGSIACYLLSVRNGRREIRRLGTALAAEIGANKLVKERGKKMLTEDQYNELFYGIKKSGETREDMQGREIEQYEWCYPTDNNFDQVVGPQKIAVSKHAIVYEKGCAEWTSNWDYCRTWIVRVEEWANREVLKNGFVRLNDIRDRFGLPALDECEDLGIVFEPERAQHQVDFEVFEMNSPNSQYDDRGYRRENPKFVIDINYEYIKGKINHAIAVLNE